MEGTHTTVDAWTVRQDRVLTVLLTNHALPRHPIETDHVHIQLTGAPSPLAVFVERIDPEHANAKRLWQEMGEPEYLSPKQVEQLK